MPEDVTIETLIEQNRRATHTYLRNRLPDSTPSYEEFNEMIDKGLLSPDKIYRLYTVDGYDVPDPDQFKRNLGIGYGVNEPKVTPVAAKEPYEDKTERQKTIYDHYRERDKSIENDINRQAVDIASQIQNINETRSTAIMKEITDKYQKIADEESTSPRWQDPLWAVTYEQRLKNQAMDEFNGRISELNDETEKFYENSIKNITDIAYQPIVLDVDDLNKKRDEIFAKDWYMNLSTEGKNNILKANWLVYSQNKMKEGTLKPENYYQAKKEYMYHMLTPLFKEGKNKADTYALKSYLASLQGTIKEELKEQQQKFKVNPLTNSLQYIGEESDRQDEFDKLQALRIANDNITRSLSIPDGDEAKLKDISKGLGSMKYYDYVPFIAGIADIADNTKILSLAKRAERGDELSDEEAQMFNALGAIAELEQKAPRNLYYQTGKIIGQAIPYVGEFALTSGAFTTGRAVTTKAIQSMVLKTIEKKVGKAASMAAMRKAVGITTKGVSGTAIKTLTYSVGALAQTAANPQSYMANTLDRMQPEIAFMMTDGGTPIMSVIDMNSAEGFNEAFLKGFGQSYSEFFTEKMGEHFFKYIPKKFNRWTNNAIPKGMSYMGKRSQDWLKRTMVGNYLRSKGIDVKVPGFALKTAAEKNFSWSGLISEYGEEFVNTRMSDFITGDYEGGRLAALAQWDWEEEKLTSMAVLGMSIGFGAPGGIQKGVHWATHGNNVTFSYQNDEGVKKKIDVPKSVLNKLRFEFENEVPDVAKISKIVNESDVNEEQRAILAAMVSEEMIKKAEKVPIENISGEIKAKKVKKEEGVTESSMIRDVIDQEEKQRTIDDVQMDIKGVDQKIDELVRQTEAGESVDQSEIEDLEIRKQRLQAELETISAKPKDIPLKKEEGKGEIIYGTPAIRKTSVIKELKDENVVDADDLLLEFVRKEGLEYESPEFFEQDYALIASHHPELEKKFQKQIIKLRNEGKTIIGGNNWLRNIADRAILSDDVEALADELVKRDKLPRDKALKRAERLIAKEAEIKDMPVQRLKKGEVFTKEMIFGETKKEKVEVEKPVEIKEEVKEEVKPVEIAPTNLEKIKENIPVTEKKKRDMNLSEYEGKRVVYNGKPYMVKKEGNHYTLDSDNSVIELEDGTLKELGIDLSKEDMINKKSYETEIISEEEVMVNGNNYKINTDEKGNIVSLSPMNNKKQQIKNERMIVAVEIERNKKAFNEIDESGYEQAKEEHKELATIESVYSQGYDDVIDGIMGKVIDGEEISNTEKNAISNWLNNSIYALKREYKQEPNEVIGNAIDNLILLNLMVHKDELESKETGTVVPAKKKAGAKKERYKVDEKTKQPTKVEVSTEKEEQKLKEELPKKTEKDIAEETKKVAKTFKDDERPVMKMPKVLLRYGAVEGEGASFAISKENAIVENTEGVDGYIYDDDIKIADVSDERTISMLKDVALEGAKTDKEKEFIKKWKWNDSNDFEYNKPISDAAKKLGYDGMSEFDITDIDKPSSINVWNLKKIKPARVSARGKSHDQYIQDVVDNSYDPEQLYEAYIQLQSDFEKLASWEQRLTEYRFNQDSFIRFSDENNITSQMRLNWFTSEKDHDIDTASQELSEDYIMDITPDMIVDFIIEHPGRISRISNEKVKIAKRYKAITENSIEASKFELKYMLGNSPSTELLLTDDPELSSFIFDHLKKQYPGIEVLSDRKKFEEFVRKVGGRDMEVSPDAIGAALRNVAFIDPKKAKQSTPIHEYAHIYWDMIGDNPVKDRLIKLYEKEGIPKENIEEAIITDIALAGTEEMRARFKGGVLNQFLSLLRNFWREVKKVLGIASKKDLIFDMANSVLKNRHNINPSTINGNNVIKYMVEKDGSVYESDPSFSKVGGREKFTVHGLINVGKKSDGDISTRIDEVSNKLKHKLTVSGKDQDNAMIQTLIEEEEKLKAMLSKKKEVDNAVSDIISNIFAGKTDENLIEYTKQIIGKTNVETIIDNARKMKQVLKNKYPDSKMYIREPHYSEQRDVEFTPDIYIVDNNKISVYGIKTEQDELVDDTGVITKRYRDIRGKMNYPLKGKQQSYETLYSLEMALQAKLLVDEYNEQFPDKKYAIGGLGVIPVQAIYDKEGDFEKIKMSGKFIDLDYSNKRVVLMKDISNIFGYIDSVNKAMPDIDTLEDNLKRQNRWDSFTISNIVKAIKAFTAHTGKDLKEIKAIDLEVMRGTGISRILHRLESLGYTEEELKGMTFEQMFYASEMGLDRKHLKMNFKDVVVETNYQVGFKPENKNSLYSIDMDGEKVFLSPISKDTKKASGEDVVMILTVKGEGGMLVNDYEKGKIINYNEIDKYFLIKLKSGVVRKSYVEHNNLLSVVKDSKGKSIVPLKNAFDITPDYVVENHYKPNEAKMKFEEDKFGGYISGMRMLWNFFNKYPTLNSIRLASQNKEEMMEQYSYISTIVGNELSDYVSSFVRDVLTNHTFAEGISEEAKYGLDQIRPFTSEVYQMITGDETILYKDHKGLALSGLTHSYQLQDRFLPLRMVSGIVEGNHMEYQKEMYGLRNLLNKYKKNIDQDNLVVSENGRTYFQRPENYKEGSSERMVLERVYELYKKIFPGFNIEQDMIRVPESYMGYDEFKTNVTGIRSRHIYNMLRPDSELDYIKLDYNSPQGIKVLTLREIKDRYIVDKNMTDKERERIFGTRILHPLSKIPVLRRKNWGNGELGEYINKARKILVEGKDKNNLNISKNIKSLKISSWGSVKYKTENVINATEKYFKAQLYKYHMREALPLYDYVKGKYDGEMNAYKWLEGYINGAVYKQGMSGPTSKEIVYLSQVAAGLFSMAKIGMTVKTQVYNYSIGKLNNLTYMPNEFLKGQQRTNPANPEGFKKAITLMRMLGHIDMVDNVLFDISDVSPSEKFIKKMYWLMEKTELGIQKDLIAGQLTEKEWNSFNGKGDILDPDNFPTTFRARAILNNAMSIHGAYNRIVTAPWLLTPIGRQVGLMKKWMFALIHRWGARPYRDVEYVWQSGIIPSLMTFGKLLSYKLSPETEKKRMKLLNAIKDAKDINENGVNNVNDYVKLILANIKNGKISLREDLSQRDKTNLKALMIWSGLFAMIYLMMKKTDDEENLKGTSVITKYIVNPYLKKILSEYGFWTNTDNYEGIGAAALSMLPEAIYAFSSAFEVVEQDNEFTEKGSWGFPQKALRLVPGGQFGRNTWKNIVFARKWISGELDTKLNAEKHDSFVKAMENQVEYPDNEEVVRIMKQIELSVNKLMKEAKEKEKALMWKTDEEPLLENNELVREQYEEGMKKEKVVKETTKKAKRVTKPEDFKKLMEKMEKELEGIKIND